MGFALAFTCANASKCEKSHQMRTKGTNLNADILVHIGKFLTPRDFVGKMTGTCKQWSKVNWKLVYENLTPTNDPIAVFKKIDEEKFILEDPMNLLDPAINGYKYDRGCPTINFSTATWEDVFQYLVRMRYFLRDDRFNRFTSKNSTEFMKALAISTVQNCPLDFKVRGDVSPVKFAVQYNDVDVASMLLQRGAVNETDVLEEAIFDCNVEIVTILLESGADVHAEVDFGGGPTPIYEWCAQYLLFYEEENANYSSVHELERLKKINKLVMEKKEKTTI